MKKLVLLTLISIALLTAFSNELDSLNTKLAKLEANNTVLSSEIDNIENVLSELNQNITTLESKIDQILKEYPSQDDSIADDIYQLIRSPIGLSLILILSLVSLTFGIYCTRALRKIKATMKET